MPFSFYLFLILWLLSFVGIIYAGYSKIKKSNIYHKKAKLKKGRSAVHFL